MKKERSDRPDTYLLFPRLRPSRSEKKETRINLVFPTMSADPRPTPSQSLADFRLNLSPSYVLVGVYRLSTDASIRVPVWKKCKHGFLRGAFVALVWVSPNNDRHRPAQPTVFPDLLHVWNSKELHPTLPVKVCPLLMICHGVHSHPHARSARVIGLSNRSFFGYTVPFELTTRMRLFLSILYLDSHLPIHSPSQWLPSLLSEIK